MVLDRDPEIIEVGGRHAAVIEERNDGIRGGQVHPMVGLDDLDPLPRVLFKLEPLDGDDVGLSGANRSAEEQAGEDGNYFFNFFPVSCLNTSL